MIYIAYEEYNGRAKTSVTSFPFITAAIEELYNRIEYDWALLLKRTCSSWEKKIGSYTWFDGPRALRKIEGSPVLWTCKV